MFENRRIITKTAEAYREALGKEAEGKYVEGVMLYNKLRNEGNNDPYVQVLGEHLDRMDKLITTEKAFNKIMEDSIRSLMTKIRTARKDNEL